MTLLQELESAAVDSNVPVTDLLRKCKVLAARLKHQEFASWINNELNGYPDKDSVPKYRRTRRGPSLGHFAGPFGQQLKNAPIPMTAIPEQLRDFVMNHVYVEPISEVVTLSESEEELGWMWPADMVSYIAHNREIYEGMTLLDARCPISPPTVKAIVDTVRTRVLDFVLAIQAENPDAGDIAPNAAPPIPIQTVTQHYHTTIVGGQANVGNLGPASIGDSTVASVGNSQSVGLQDATVRELLVDLRTSAQALVEAEDRAEAISALQKVEVQLAKPKPDLDRIKQYLGLFGTIVTVAAPTVEKLVQYLGPMLMQ